MNPETIFLRKRFEEIKAEVQTFDKTLVPQSSYIRIDQTLENGVGTYTFDPLLNNGGAGPLEKKLDKNDLFFISSINLAITATNKTLPADVVFLNTINPDKLNACISTAGLASLKTDLAAAPGLNTIFNGFISLRTGQTVSLQNFPTLRFCRISDTDASIDGASVILPERVLLNGASDQRFELVFNGQNTTMQNATTPAYTFGVSLFMSGFLVKSGARIVEQLTPNK